MNILSKSGSNYEAGVILKTQNLNDPSAHCFYYSSFMLLKHILNNRLGYHYIDQDGFRGDSHRNISIRIEESLHSDHNTYNIFYENFNALKRLRKKADYSSDFITSEDICNAEFYSRTINEQLKHYFEI